MINTKARIIAWLGLATGLTMFVAFWRENAQAWQGYQRESYQLQATQARAALRLAGSEAERLAAQARLAQAE